MSTSRLSSEMLESLRHARRIVVLTGAGVSAESGVPTFRDRQTGLWKQFDATQLATAEAFRRDPALVWGWYEWRRTLVQRAEPNPAHRALAQLERCVPAFTLVTQNVDDLHERAGSARMLHLHGRIDRARCFACARPYAHPPGVAAVPDGGARIEPPRCEACGGRVRPGVVWFGESLPVAEWQAALEAASNCDALLCVGTSAVVQPAAWLVGVAMQAGAVTVQVNPNPTELDREVSLALRGRAGEVLPRLVEAVWPGCRTSPGGR